MTFHPVLFVGAGPGDPDLITVKGRNALQEADLVIYAGSLVPEAVLRWTRPECETINSAGLHLEEFMPPMIASYREGRRVVRLHTGDPSLYGAITEQIGRLKQENIPYQIIPGVTAAFAAAAALGVEYTLPEVTQTLIFTRMAGKTPVPETEALRSLARHRASMAIYLSISMVDRVTEALVEAYGPDTPAAVAYKVSHPEEKLFRTTIRELPDLVRREKIRKTALILVGQALGTDPTGAASRLYDRSFSHEFRKSPADP